MVYLLHFLKPYIPQVYIDHNGNENFIAAEPDGPGEYTLMIKNSSGILIPATNFPLMASKGKARKLLDELAVQEGWKLKAGRTITHYIGYSQDENFEIRMQCHKNGTGSKLMRAVAMAGIEWEIARTWPGEDGNFERKLKNRKQASVFCPVCQKLKQVKDQR